MAIPASNNYFGSMYVHRQNYLFIFQKEARKEV